MGKWFPAVYDILMTPLEHKKFKGIRRHLIGKAEGHVLEIGCGTGVNFPFYKNSCHVTAIEPNPTMTKRSLQNINKALVPIEICSGEAEELNYKENTFDTVVATLVFCTISNPQKALKEIYRVLKPGGRLLLFEHVRMNDPILSKIQDVLTPIWKRMCDGCHLNRETFKFIIEAGFQIEKAESFARGLFLITECYIQEFETKMFSLEKNSNLSG